MVNTDYEYMLLLFLQQLHSSVRTGNLETCLRLLSLGARANYFHPVSTWRRGERDEEGERVE